MYFSSGDLQLFRQFNRSLPEQEQAVAHQKLGQVQRFAMSATCRHHQLLQYFDEQRLEESCGACDNCLHPRQMFDASQLCQKILSCIYRLERPYSPTYITNILTGQADEMIKKRQHDKLSVFGIIKDYQAPQLRQILLELSDRGYISINVDDYNAVSLTTESIPVLKGQQKVELSDLFLPKRRKVKPVSVPGRAMAFSYNQQDVDRELFEQLRQLRTSIASEEGMPPYIIFADTSLTDMAIQRPASLEEFANIYGVGQQKLEKYGERFVAAIKEYGEKI
jgi:ATP-dependent DNA helicase RecQ